MPPFYVYMVLLLMAFSLLLCFGCYAFAHRALPAVPLYGGNPFPTPWDALYTAIFITVLLGSLAANLPWDGAAPVSEGSHSARSLLYSTLLQSALYLPMVIRFASLPHRHRPSFGFRRCLRMVLGSVGLIFLFSMLLGVLHADDLIMRLTDCPKQQDVVQLMMDGSGSEKAILAAAAVIMAPIGEEICFRGFVYNILRQRAGIFAATLATGVLFGAIHGSLVQFLPLTFFGIVQCRLYEESKTLLLPMAVHAVFNSLSVLFILLLPYMPDIVRQSL